MLTAKRVIVLAIATVFAVITIGGPMLRRRTPDAVVAAQVCFGAFVGDSDSDLCVPLP